MLLSTFCSWSSEIANDSLDIFILGQSNMVGYGDIKFEDRVDIPGAYVLRTSEPSNGVYSWQHAHQPFNVALPSYRFSLTGPFLKSHRQMYFNVKVGAVSHPVAVQYAFTDYAKGYLYNIEGCCASSFRTDTWDDKECTFK